MMLYFIFFIPGLLLMLWAQSRVKGSYKKYSKVRNMAGVTGEQAARSILDVNGLYDVQIKLDPDKRKSLSDHYDPRVRVLVLSHGVYDSKSIAAVGIAAHEAGHAIQHAQAYGPLVARTNIVPVVGVGSNLGYIMLLAGLFMQITGLAWAGVALFSLATVFAAITLPVEFDASKRAKDQLVRAGIVDNGVQGGQEVKDVEAMLDAAAWTYIAGFAMALLQLLYLVMMVQSND
jgi:uncharacterized protein